MPERLDAVLTVIYLIFNEGYAATRGGPLREDRSLRRGDPPGAAGADVDWPAALRRRRPRCWPSCCCTIHGAMRVSMPAGDLVILEEQDRRRWDQAQIAEALPLVEEAFRGGPGPFAVQAAIAALHCQAARAEDTDWPQIVRLYDLLERLQPSPIVSLNRAVAVAMVDGPGAALALIDALAAGGDLDGYHLLHAARADLLRRAGSPAGSGGELRAGPGTGHQRQRAAVSRTAAAGSSVTGGLI